MNPENGQFLLFFIKPILNVKKIKQEYIYIYNTYIYIVAFRSKFMIMMIDDQEDEAFL